MDARFPALLALSLALAACSSAPPAAQAPVGNPGLEVFEALIDQPPAYDSLIRQGDQVTYMIQPTTEKPWLARFDASCSQASGQMFYKSTGGMRSFSDDADPKNLPQPQLQALRQSEQLRQACSYRPAPDWRALATQEGQDWPLLDRNSAVHEDGVLKVWTASQLARYRVAQEYTRIAQVQERLAVDCTQQQFKRLSQFMVDNNGRVYTGRIDLNLPMTPVAQTSSEQRRLIATACQPPASWASLATPPERKPLEPQLSTPKAAPAVLTAIRSLDLPEPRLSLQHLEYRYDALMLHRMKIEDVKREDTLSRDPESGQLLMQTADSVIGTKRLLTFRGLIELANSSFDRRRGGEAADTLHITGLAFKGDWQHLPENTEVSYSKTQTNTTKPFTSTVTCSIGSPLPASRIHPDLQGRAKPLTCSTVKPKLTGNERYNYLEDYGVFVREEQDGAMGRWTWRVNAVH